VQLMTKCSSRNMENCKETPVEILANAAAFVLLWHYALSCAGSVAPAKACFTRKIAGAARASCASPTLSNACLIWEGRGWDRMMVNDEENCATRCNGERIGKKKVGVNVVKTHPESSDGFFECGGRWCGSYKRVEDGVDAVSWSHDQTAADELRMWKKIA